MKNILYIWYVIYSYKWYMKKRDMTIQISPAPNRRHSKMYRDFWKKLPICIFGCPKLYLGWKNFKNFFSIFSTFHRGDHYVFSQISSKSEGDICKNFLRKIVRVPSMKNEKIWKKFSWIFFIQDISVRSISYFSYRPIPIRTDKFNFLICRYR